MGDFRATAGGAECCCELGSPIVHIGSPTWEAFPKRRSGEVSFGREFQAHEHIRTKVLQSFTQAPLVGRCSGTTNRQPHAFQDRSYWPQEMSHKQHDQNS